MALESARRRAHDGDMRIARRTTAVVAVIALIGAGCSDDDDAAAEIGALAEDLGFAPIQLGGLAEGGLLVQTRGTRWGHLIFKDLVKFD